VRLLRGTSITIPTYAYAADGKKGKVTWKNAKKSVTTVTKVGRITAKKAGTATITVKGGTKSGT
jgi:uncharacterized protein YjdB